VNDRQERLGNLHVAPLCDGGMAIAAFAQLRVAAPVVSDDGGAGRNSPLDESAQRLGAAVRCNGKADASRVAPGLAIVEAALLLALADFDRAGHENHVVYASALAAGTPTDVGFIGLDVFVGLAADPILVRAYHAGAQLVENLKGRFVPRQPKLALELNGRHAGGLAGNQVRRPEPDRQSGMRTFHDGAGGKARIAVAMTAPQNARTIGKTVRLVGRAAVLADESLAPPGAFKVGCTCRFVWEQSLELRQGARKRQIVSLEHVDNHGRPRLA
jgi:hypothetical protein